MQRLAAYGWVLCALIACSSGKDKGETGGTAGTSTGGSAGDPDAESVLDSGGAADETRDPGEPRPPSDAAAPDTPLGDDDAAVEGASATGVNDAASYVDAPDDVPGIYDSSLRQIEKPLGTTASSLGYLEYLPPGYGDGTKRPLLVFVHGITESGNGTTDLSKLLVRGPPKLIAQNKWPDDRPFVVLSLQHPADMECARAAEVHDFISYALTQYDIDPARVYLTGLSCGALASWNYIAVDRASQVAAAVLVAGDGRPAWNVAGCGLATVAIWGFHAEGDETIDENGTIEPINQLKACPSPPAREVKATIYAGSSHDSWSRTYDLSAGYDIYAWLLGVTL
jgi:predicted esterase